MNIKDLIFLTQSTQRFFIYQNVRVERDFSPPVLSLADIGGLKPRPTAINVFRLKFIANDRKAENGF